jgi:hypothetical protein
MPPASRAELPIIQATIDLIRWYVPLLNRLPRDHRFGLVGARCSKAKLPLLEPLPARLDLLQIQTRLLQDFQLIDVGRYEHASRLLDGVGRQLTGWLGQQRQTLGSPSPIFIHASLPSPASWKPPAVPSVASATAPMSWPSTRGWRPTSSCSSTS